MTNKITLSMGSVAPAIDPYIYSAWCAGLDVPGGTEAVAEAAGSIDCPVRTLAYSHGWRGVGIDFECNAGVDLADAPSYRFLMAVRRGDRRKAGVILEEIKWAIKAWVDKGGPIAPKEKKRKKFVIHDYKL